MSNKNIFWLSLLFALIFLCIIDIFYTDLPPYSIRLAKVNSYIYITNDQKVEIYSVLDYKKTFWFNFPSKGITLSFPVFEKVLDYRGEGFSDFYYLAPNNLQGVINYKDFSNEKFFGIYLKVEVNKKNKYIHTFDLPYFWSSDAKVEHQIFVDKKYKVIVLNISPSKIVENKEKTVIFIDNTKKQRLIIEWI